MFPLAKDERDSWYVRQKGYKGERSDLPCLDPASSRIPAATSLQSGSRSSSNGSFPKAVRRPI
jgi:hypothetical protein